MLKISNYEDKLVERVKIEILSTVYELSFLITMDSGYTEACMMQ